MKKYAIVGASKRGLSIKRKIEHEEVGEVCCFIDNNSKKQGLIFDGIPIISMDEIVSGYSDLDEIIVAIIDHTPLLDQINEKGIKTPISVVTPMFILYPGQTPFKDCCALRSNDKPAFSYIEYHIADHCNLKCKGCGHLSNVVEEKFGDYELYKKDLLRLKELFWNITKIRLLGGEPLLNPELEKFIIISREMFPASDIRVVTNGLLIPSANENLFKTMRRNAVTFDISLYPTTQKVMERIELKCTQYDVLFNVSGLITKFSKSKKGDYFNSDPQNVFKTCINRKCHLLYNGEIALCPGPILRKRFEGILCNKPWFEEDIINIYDEDLDGNKLNELFSGPNRFCTICGPSESFDWEPGYTEII
ncbi:MAG: 4Fe-4S cluster-binding domain-containing protein [Lachnospiraceae bacterium]|nr:4Fe-4S cluster-binding domain-containing protein [Lachnospiraceae bacterium]